MNSSTNAPSPPTLPMRRHRRWLLGMLAFIAFAAICVFATKPILDWRTRAAWADAEAEADRLDPGWRLKDLLAKLEPIPADENSALLIRDLATDTLVRRIGTRENPKAFENYPVNARLNDAQIRLIAPQLKNLSDRVETARRLMDMPRGRLPRSSEDRFENVSGDTTLHILDWLRFDAFLLAHEEKHREAAESCLAMLNAGRSNNDSHGFVMLLARSVYCDFVAEALERVLAQGTVPEETLRKIQSSLEEDAKVNSFLHAARGERASLHLFAESIFSGKRPVEDLLARPDARNWFNTKFPSMLLYQFPSCLRNANQMVEIAKMPIHERQPHLAALRDEYTASGNLLDFCTFDFFHAEDAESHRSLRCAIVAIACERYRMNHKSWPTKLDVLVTERYLTEIPSDPSDGARLRMLGTPDGIVIYSVGANGLDEQGNMRRHGFVGPSDDQGFRLWNEQMRGQPPIAPIERKKG